MYNHLPRAVDSLCPVCKEKKYFKKIRMKLNILNYAKQLEEFYDKEKAPNNMSFRDFLSYLQQFTTRKHFTDNLFKKKVLQKRKWRFLVVAGMQFQDSYNYEAERSQRCVVHYAAPNGKLYPFCTYNSGPYFRTETEKQFAKPSKN